MHAINRGSSLVLPREEFFTPDGTRNDVTDKRVPLWQVGSEVHLLPIRKVKPIIDNSTSDKRREIKE